MDLAESPTPRNYPEALAAWQLQVEINATIHKKFEAQIQGLQSQLDWFRQQFFGQKSERRVPPPPVEQLSLGQEFSPAEVAPAPLRIVAAHTRAAPKRPEDRAESLPFFDESRVPTETITLPAPEIAGLDPDACEIIDTKVSYRLAQRPGSYVVLKYERPVVKLRESETLHTAPAPMGVLDGSRADVSLLAGILTDKFLYHLPLYRQHQRMVAQGLRVSRSWLTDLVQRSILLLSPIYTAQFESIRQSRVLTMDETPIKAGRREKGKMHQGYFWPVFGDAQEICFPYAESRGTIHIRELLGPLAPGTVLLSDGYAAYARFQKENAGLIHAQCWAHSRREFVRAEAHAPERVAEALEQIRAFYRVEDEIRSQGLSGADKRHYRYTHSRPRVAQFFTWVEQQLTDTALLPSNPFTKALAYVHSRKGPLQVFLEEPDVPIDTNHIECQIRPIPLGRKNWLFCWTELGAEHLGIIQSLLSTCRLQGIDPYDYLVDVLQRVGQHPAKDVAQLTPRLWKEHFAQAPLRSDLHRFQQHR
ncbi:IS66 family transposase [Acidithiobacillus acidisediminis]|jgi:transposase|uniref:IS66 family transposase n=1 Tax=Acidithiobacillus acidisediminis TaxID=2937799 RepID=UPI00200EDB23|nr:IS66 family transposase [Acidithiobacillus sp. S30A2]MCL5051647.1 IS66 family transposase [Gammaproteobacteria bacterium]